MLRLVGNSGTRSSISVRDTPKDLSGAQGKNEEDSLSTIWCASTKPVDTDNPITTYMPTRSLGSMPHVHKGT